MLSCLVSHHICEIVSCYPVWLDNINMNYFMPSFIPHYPLHLSYHTMFVHSITFLVYQPFELERVMAVSKGVTTRSSENIVLPVDADRTTVVLAKEPAPPHITQTLADCTPCRCQNRQISGRGSRTVRLGSMVTGDGGHDVLPRFGPSLWR